MKISKSQLVCLGIILMFIVFGYSIHRNYTDIKENGAYAIGEVTKRGTRKEMWFKFTIKNDFKKEYYGRQSLPFFVDRKLIKKGDKYLLIYSKLNPENNIMIIDYPIMDSNVLDSLNEIGIDIGYINVLYL